MGIFDTGITDTITKALEDLANKQSTATANAVIEGFERAAHIIADRLEEIEKGKK